MNKSGVYVIGVTNIGENICAAAGRISTQNGTAMEIFDRSQDKDKNSALIKKVTSSGHTSTVEHIFFNLAFENVSVIVEQFMIEFRLASFTVKSRRYVDFADSGYYVPQSLSDDDCNEYVRHMNKLFELYSTLTKGGIPKEDARFVLPYCFFSNFYCSANGRELVNILRSMLFGRGKKIAEIYNLGCSLLEQCQKIAPGVFGDFDARYGNNISDEVDLSFIEPNEIKTDKQTVELLAYPENAEYIVCKTALIESLGLSGDSAETLCKSKETRNKIIKAVLASSRPRALESVNYTVRFNGVSLSTLTHFTRHRVQSLQIPSLTLCDRSKFIIPPSVRENKDLLQAYKDAFLETNELYERMTAKSYSHGETVYCLLSGNTVDIVSTLNGREMLLFMKLRTCNRAQWEIRIFAKELLRQLRLLSPELFDFYGPSCYCSGYCPEGKLTCGKMKEVLAEFGKEKLK